MPRAKKNKTQEEVQKTESKVFGYVVGRAPADQDHPDKKQQNA